LGAHYIDTSSFVKLYVREPGTEQMVRLADPSSGHTLYVLGLTRVEFRSAVRLRERKGDLARDVSDALISRMDQHLKTIYLVQLVTDAVLEQAVALLDRHPLKAYDAVQLAGCLALQANLDGPVTFVCSDEQLLRAAEAERLQVINPAAVD
jgi:uncharacterized protein